jgi:hypothetical protein
MPGRFPGDLHHYSKFHISPTSIISGFPFGCLAEENVKPLDPIADVFGISDRSGLAVSILVEHESVSLGDLNVVLRALPEDYIFPPAEVQTPPEIFVRGTAHDWGREATEVRALRTFISFRRMTEAAFSCSRR